MLSNTIIDEIEEHNEDGFEEIQENICTVTLVQNVLTTEQPTNLHNQLLVVAPGQGSKPLGLFQDVHSEKLNFPTFFFGKPCKMQISVPLSYQKIEQQAKLQASLSTLDCNPTAHKRIFGMPKTKLKDL